MMTQPEFAMIETNGIRLRTALAGKGPLVVLVHGWPESWYSWRHQIKTLADAGYRVAAPDVRGYGGSDKPQAIEAYSIKELAADIAGLIEGLGEKQALLIGHDWGAPIVCAVLPGQGAGGRRPQRAPYRTRSRPAHPTVPQHLQGSLLLPDLLPGGGCCGERVRGRCARLAAKDLLLDLGRRREGHDERAESEKGARCEIARWAE